MVLQRTGYWLSKVCLLAINETDILRNVYGLSDFLCKSLLKPSAWKRSWQRQHKEYVETWGQAWDITRASQRHRKDNEKTKRTNEDKPRASWGQKKDLQRPAPTESRTLPTILSRNTHSRFSLWTSTFLLCSWYFEFDPQCLCEKNSIYQNWAPL